MQVEIKNLRAANELLSKRKSRKRKVLKGVTTIAVADGLQLKDAQATTQAAALKKAVRAS